MKKTTEKLEAHRFANIFPMMATEDIDALADDIRINGCHTPILIYEDKILDGRNRVEACRIAGGAKYDIEKFKGTKKQALAVAIGKNLNRRHLTTAQRAMVAAELSSIDAGEEDGENSANLRTGQEQEAPTPKISQAQAAKALKVSRRSVTTAAKINKSASKELKKDVMDGKKSLNEAESLLPPDPEPQEKPIDADALKRIGVVLGPEFVKALKTKALRMSQADIVSLSHSSADQMRELEPLLVGRRWELKRCKRFLSKMPDADSKVTDLMSYCLAGGGKWDATIDGFKIIVEHVARK